MRCGTDQRLSGYVDGELSTEHTAKVSEHLRTCAECAAVVDQIQQIKREAALLQDHEPPADLLQRSLDAMERTPAPGWSWLLIGVGSAAAAASLAGVLLTLNAGPDDQGLSSGSAAGPTPPHRAGAGSTVTARGTARGDGGAAGQTDAAVAPETDRKLAATKRPRQRTKRVAPRFHRVEDRYRRTVAELRALADQQSRMWSPGERQRYLRARHVFDQAIRDGRAAAALTTSDPRAQDMLLDTYRQEIRYLQQSILKGALPDPSTGRPDLPTLPATHTP